jgi:hypothetical protein
MRSLLLLEDLRINTAAVHVGKVEPFLINFSEQKAEKSIAADLKVFQIVKNI